jgi:long-chain acyl-CoA synthetase
MAGGGVWAFDVDGCIVDLLGGTSLRPHSRDLLVWLRSSGATVVLWSAGGADHARRRAEVTGIFDLIDGFYGKPARGVDGRWTVDHMPAEHRPTVCVDDSPDDVPRNVRVIAVRPYIAPTSHDNEFLKVITESADSAE